MPVGYKLSQACLKGCPTPTQEAWPAFPTTLDKILHPEMCPSYFRAELDLAMSFVLTGSQGWLSWELAGEMDDLKPHVVCSVQDPFIRPPPFSSAVPFLSFPALQALSILCLTEFILDS